MTQSTYLIIVKDDDKRKFRDILFKHKKSISPAIATIETMVDTEAEIKKSFKPNNKRNRVKERWNKWRKDMKTLHRMQPQYCIGPMCAVH
mmetsp:Transcript_24752/g.27706  ORF Transcript_24752/g.27706 Transcript_24752/m.27706 type:complete len:90 (+) Transcript_24752:65-334(+)